jgi:hypothetical protein
MIILRRGVLNVALFAARLGDVPVADAVNVK